MSRAWIERIFYSHSHPTTTHFAKYLSLDGFRALTTHNLGTYYYAKYKMRRGTFARERARASRLYPSRYENRNDMCQSAASRAGTVVRLLPVLSTPGHCSGRCCWSWEEMSVRKRRLENEGVFAEVEGAAVGECKIKPGMILFVWWF